MSVKSDLNDMVNSFTDMMMAQNDIWTLAADVGIDMPDMKGADRDDTLEVLVRARDAWGSGKPTFKDLLPVMRVIDTVSGIGQALVRFDPDSPAAQTPEWERFMGALERFANASASLATKRVCSR